MAEFHQGLYLIPPEDIATGGVTNEMARRWNVLQNLQVLPQLDVKGGIA